MLRTVAFAIQDPNVRLQDIIKGWVNGHGTREPGDGRRETLNARPAQHKAITG